MLRSKPGYGVVFELAKIYQRASIRTLVDALVTLNRREV